jgi:hypothetical protein
MRTYRMSFVSNSKSIQLPWFGMIRAVKISFAPPVLLRLESKKMPGLRWSWDTTTRSVPLMMNVPFSVISGISPKYTGCSLM